MRIVGLVIGSVLAIVGGLFMLGALFNGIRIYAFSDVRPSGPGPVIGPIALAAVPLVIGLLIASKCQRKAHGGQANRTAGTGQHEWQSTQSPPPSQSQNTGVGSLKRIEQKSLGVESSYGWTINRGLPGHLVLYTDRTRAGENTVRIAIDEYTPDAPGRSTIIESEWLWGRMHGPNREVVSESDRKVIVERLATALRFLGNDVTISPSAYDHPDHTFDHADMQTDLRSWQMTGPLDWRYEDPSGIVLHVRFAQLDDGTLLLHWQDYLRTVELAIASHSAELTMDKVTLAGLLMNDTAAAGYQLVIQK